MTGDGHEVDRLLEEIFRPPTGGWLTCAQCYCPHVVSGGRCPGCDAAVAVLGWESELVRPEAWPEYVLACQRVGLIRHGGAWTLPDPMPGDVLAEIDWLAAVGLLKGPKQLDPHSP